MSDASTSPLSTAPPAFDRLSEPLSRALDCAHRIADLGSAVLQDLGDFTGFADELRRLRRDLPHLNKQVMAAFHGDGPLAADLRHELACVAEDACQMADWLGPARAELQRLFEATCRADCTPDAALRFGQSQTGAFAEAERRRQAILESCNRAHFNADMVCTAADKAAEQQAATDRLESLTQEKATGDQGGTGQAEGRNAKHGRGRKPDPSINPAADRRLCDHWQAAKREGASRASFCHDRGITVQVLIDAQHREKYRRTRDAE